MYTRVLVNFTWVNRVVSLSLNLLTLTLTFLKAQGREGMITTQKTGMVWRLALLFLGPDLSLTKTDTFGLTGMFSGHGLFALVEKLRWMFQS